MKMNGARFEALIADLEAAIDGLTSQFHRDPSLWNRGAPGKWTAGQHADHVAIGLGVTAEALEKSEQKRREGSLGTRPVRGPLQALFVAIAVGAGKFPRGVKAPRNVHPSANPERSEVLERISREAARHRSLGAGLETGERDRLWIVNPFRKRWHYTFPEVLRMHAVHFRHHSRQIEEIAARAGGGRADGRASSSDSSRT